MYLLADLGRANTRAALIEKVEGEYRAVARGGAPSTFGPPWEDARISFQEALAEISQIRRLPLVSPEGKILLQQGGGAEALFSTASAAPPLRVAALGLSGEYSL
ncbi:MAG: glutamate mutase L, partial [Chloroflexi bacterium]|nr:glutamate mutase L [Chloroflexota bacterium]